MIVNLWNKITLLCANHDYPVKMRPHDPGTGLLTAQLYGAQTNMFYSCPKYYEENRKEGETLCRNHISMKEFENLLNYISKEIETAEEDGGQIDLSGDVWKSKNGTVFKIVSHTEDEIVVSCLNERSLWKK